ncbi:glycosyltransferase [Rhodohalobacter sp. 614A]|uniref:glycosyltransferase n=1 Tax=Rhodohalobacter sp. 614A TaxID=2908649 RepID=UPI001F3B5CCB|nr:glycosyltransferase [Rhodohalobacter sp. 614A]
MKIGFIYYTFYPVSGGASVHGYNLAKELHAMGYELYKINGAADPFTTKLQNPVSGIFRILASCDVIYIRMDYFLNLRNLVSLFAIAGRKKIIVEINSPSDELHLFGRSGKYIRLADRIMRNILKHADAVITVSESLKKYCKEALNLDKVYVVENGGEIFPVSDYAVSKEVEEKFVRIRQKYSKIVVWSGSLNEMQDLSGIQKIAESQKEHTAVILIVKEDLKEGAYPTSLQNLFVFKNLSRDDVKYIISKSDIGLALYSEYPWSRWGFYNSSLKIFEYLNNGLLTITNTEGTRSQNSYPNFRFVENMDEMIRVIENHTPGAFEIPAPRTWRDVAEETSQIIQKVVQG